jgi:drug/metabolite transporter (DMT)-like permease
MHRIHLKLIAMAVFWASSYPLGRHLAQFHVPAVVAGLRLAFATSFLLLLAFATGQLRQAFNARVVAHFALLGATGFCVHNLLMMVALQFTQANTGAVINGGIPLMVVLLDFLIFRRRIPTLGLVGVLMGCLGTAVVVTHGDVLTAFAHGIGRGETLFLIAISGWAVYSIAGRPLFALMPPLAVTTYACLAGLILMSPITLSQWAESAPLRDDWRLVLMICVQALFSMSLGFVWYFEGVKAIGAMNTSMYANLVPVVAIGLSAATLGERPDGSLLIGAGLVIGGLVVVNRAQTRLAKP